MWIFRKAYSYVNRNGKVVHVPECWYFREAQKVTKTKRKSHSCPICKAPIETIPGRNGKGWGHYDAGMSHLGVKHSCFTLGQGMSQDENAVIRELWDKDEKEQQKTPRRLLDGGFYFQTVVRPADFFEIRYTALVKSACAL